MNIETLKARARAIAAELQSLAKLAELGKRPHTKAEREQITKLKTEADAVLAEVDRLEKEQLAGTIAAIGSHSTGRRSEPDATATAPETVPAVPKAPAFRTLGEQLQAIAQAALTPHRVHPGLVWENLAPATGGAVAGVPSDGGYLIQKDFATDLRQRMFDTGQLLSRVKKIPIGAGSDGLKLTLIDETSRALGSRWGGVQVYWAAEADAATAKKPKLRQSELELKDLIGLAYATNRLLADAPAMEAVFLDAFSSEMSFMVEEAFVNGTGAGQPLGVFNSGAVVSVAKESGQPAATVQFENLNKMWSRLWARSRQTAIWIYNQDIEPQLFSMSIPVGTGGIPVFLPPGGLSEQPYATLFGRPMIPVEYCATLGTTGDIMLIDPEQYIMIDKGAMQADQSIHVRFTTNENTFRFIYRVDGQPLWNSALTPYKGTNTKSPYIKLDTRA